MIRSHDTFLQRFIPSALQAFLKGAIVVDGAVTVCLEATALVLELRKYVQLVAALVVPSVIAACAAATLTYHQRSFSPAHYLFISLYVCS